MNRLGVQETMSVESDLGEAVNHKLSFHSDNIQTISTLSVMTFEAFHLRLTTSWVILILRPGNLI